MSCASPTSRTRWQPRATTSRRATTTAPTASCASSPRWPAGALRTVLLRAEATAGANGDNDADGCDCECSCRCRCGCPVVPRPAGAAPGAHGVGAAAGRSGPRRTAVLEPVDGRRLRRRSPWVTPAAVPRHRLPRGGADSADEHEGRWRIAAAALAAVAWLVGIVLELTDAEVGGDGRRSWWRSWPVGRRSCPAPCAIWRRGRLGVGLLMSIALVGAVVLGQFGEAASLAFLFSISEALEEWAVTRSRRGLRAVLSLVPDTARVRRGAVDARDRLGRAAYR